MAVPPSSVGPPARVGSTVQLSIVPLAARDSGTHPTTGVLNMGGLIPAIPAITIAATGESGQSRVGPTTGDTGGTATGVQGSGVSSQSHSVRFLRTLVPAMAVALARGITCAYTNDACFGRAAQFVTRDCLPAGVRDADRQCARSQASCAIQP